MIGALLLTWALVHTGASVLAIARSLQKPQTPSPSAAPLRAVLIRPCAGMEPALARALRSSEGVHRVVFAVASRNDGAFDAASRIAKQLGESASVAITDARSGNRKAAQIARVLDSFPGEEIVIVADSDVVLQAGDLSALVAPIQADSSCSAVWAAPVEVAPPRTLGDHISQAVLGASLHSFALLSHIDREGMVGKLVAFRRGALEAVGGFRAMESILGEDMELGRRLRAHGQVMMSRSVLARSHAEGRSLGDVLRRYVRWASVIRAQRPTRLVGYPLLFAAWPLISLAALIVHSPLATAAAALTTLTRILIAWRAVVVTKAHPFITFAAPLADLTLFAAFMRALWARQIDWRGVSLELTRKGEIR